MNLKNLKILKNYKLPYKIKFLNKNKLNLIGKGYAGEIFLYKLENKKITIKISKIKNQEMIYKNNETALFTEPNLNELIMFIILQNSIFCQKLYGYDITNTNFYIFKEYNEITLIDYLKDKNVKNDSKILIILLLFIGLYELFQKNIKGFHNDFRIRNVVLKKSLRNNYKIKIINKNYIIPVNDYIPVLIDFEGSKIININSKNSFITSLYSNKSLINKSEKDYPKFNYYFDLNFFYEYEFIRNDSKGQKDIIPKEIFYLMSDIKNNFGKKNLNLKNILNHKLLSNYIKIEKKISYN